MDNSTWLTLFALLIGCFAVYVWKTRREIADGKAAWWANVSEPRSFVSRHPFDETVSECAAEARALLAKHGNRLLNPEADVWEYVYGATPETPTRDFDLWEDTIRLAITRRREEWRKQKMEWNGEAAKVKFGGQTITQQSAN